MCYAQFDPQMGQYMYLPTAYNPAAAGEGDLMKVAGMHRMQYVDISNAPMSTWFNFSSPFVIGKTYHGAGVRFLNDRFGLFTNQALYAQYAYRLKLGSGYLSLGVDLGFINVGFKGDSINLSKMQDDYHETSDPALPSGSKSDMKFDMGLGVYYAAPTWWAGISYGHLTMPKMDWSGGTEGEKKEMRVRGTMFITGGYHFRLKNYRDWMLTPSAQRPLPLGIGLPYSRKRQHPPGDRHHLGSPTGLHLRTATQQTPFGELRQPRDLPGLRI